MKLKMHFISLFLSLNNVSIKIYHELFLINSLKFARLSSVIELGKLIYFHVYIMFIIKKYLI